MHWPFRWGRPARPTAWALDQPVVSFSDRDVWTIGDACMGTAIMGATGAGKSTGAGAALARGLLRHGFGGLVLCCKPDERLIWERYCRAAGRSDDLVIFNASGQHRFSFLDEEVTRAGEGAGLTENIVNLTSTVSEIAERNGGQGGREDEGFWRRATRQLCRNVVDLLVMARGRVTVPDLYRLVVSAPTSLEQLASEDWKKQSFCFQCLAVADAKAKSPRERIDFELVADYLVHEFPALSDKTRSVIVSTFTSLIDVLNRSLLRELFSTDTTIRPRDTLDGKIIVVDLPVKEFAEVGQIAAVLMKYCWQRAVEHRDPANTRPVFLWADECQYFTTQYDMQFQTTARSSRAATVYLTQNISNLLAGFGGPQARALTDSLLGNLGTKIWHANGDPVTNEWAATVIGRSPRLFLNASRSQEEFDTLRLIGLGRAGNASAGFSEQMEFEVDPRRFTTLRTGGPARNWEVDAILFQGGRRFSNGKTWMPVTFRQDV